MHFFQSIDKIECGEDVVLAYRLVSIVHRTAVSYNLPDQILSFPHQSENFTQYPFFPKGIEFRIFSSLSGSRPLTLP